METLNKIKRACNKKWRTLGGLSHDLNLSKEKISEILIENLEDFQIVNDKNTLVCSLITLK